MPVRKDQNDGGGDEVNDYVENLRGVIEMYVYNTCPPDVMCETGGVTECVDCRKRYALEVLDYERLS